MIIIGIDTGGTFTDFVVYDGTSIRVHKQLSTPAAPEEAIISGLRALDINLQDCHLVHGSTVATNTLLEGKGARTVFITNRGFADTLSIARQARAQLYNLTPIPVEPPVPASLCLETGGRLAADGSLVDPLTEQDLCTVREQVTALKPQAVAISTLFSFLDPSVEKAIAESMPETVFVSLSSEVLPEHREYERGIATWLNACTGPVMRGYLERLGRAVAPATLAIMQSSAVSCAPEFAAVRAVNLLLSGPAGGLLGARHIAQAANIPRFMSFDMGGTSTDVALIDGDIALTAEGHIGPYPVSVPMVDMHTIGAGGGSIAWVDGGGLLRVGPQSAGAKPGPACYGGGGLEATVTDANLVLGHLPAGTRLGGALKVDKKAAIKAIERLATQLGGMPVMALAQGIVDIANDHMRQALRVISVERGIDPRHYTLVSFGGAGGLHVCALAESLRIERALVPCDAGVLSALGMVVARPGRRLSHTLRRPFDELTDDTVEALFEEIAAPGIAALVAEGHDRSQLTVRRSVDLCYRGQSFALNLSYSTNDDLASRFHQEHQRRYGHRLSHALEVVNLRVAVDGPDPDVTIVRTFTDAADDRAQLAHETYPVHTREAVKHAGGVSGPAIVVDAVATAFVAPNWRATVDEQANLALEFNP